MTRQEVRNAEAAESGEHRAATGSLNASEVRALLAAVEDGRDRALLSLALDAGLRLRELCALRLGDLHPQPNESAVVVIQGRQSRRQRRVTITGDTFATVRHYVEYTERSWERASDLTTPLFMGQSGRAHLSRCRAYQIVAQALADAGIQRRAHPLLLRRTHLQLRV